MSEGGVGHRQKLIVWSLEPHQPHLNLANPGKHSEARNFPGRGDATAPVIAPDGVPSFLVQYMAGQGSGLVYSLSIIYI
jgi:hypothetical protein